MGFFQSFISDANRERRVEPLQARAPVEESRYEPAPLMDAIGRTGVQPSTVPDAATETFEKISLLPPRQKIIDQTIERAPDEIPIINGARSQNPDSREFPRNTRETFRDKQYDVYASTGEDGFMPPGASVRHAKQSEKPVFKTGEIDEASEATIASGGRSREEAELPVPHTPHETNKPRNHAPDADSAMSGEAAARTDRKSAPAALPEASVQKAVGRESAAFEAAQAIQPAGLTTALVSTFAGVTEKPAETSLEAAAQKAAGRESEAAQAIQPAGRTPGMVSSFAVAMEKRPAAREKSEPLVRIGTIEVIVESAPPPVRRKSPSDTGFMRDPGRYYQRRL